MPESQPQVDPEFVDAEIRRLRIHDGDVLIIKATGQRLTSSDVHQVSRFVRSQLDEAGLEKVGVLTVNEGDFEFGVLSSEGV